MITINGRQYPLWSQFIERKEEWIGGVLEDFGDSMDKRLGYKGGTTEITDVILRENGDDSAWFEVSGEDFGCGFDVSCGGIGGDQEDGWLTFSGYGGHKWRIKQNARIKPKRNIRHNL